MSLADLSVEKTASSPDRDRGRASRAAARPTRYRASSNGSSDPASMRIRRRHSRSSASSRAVSAAPSDAPVVAWLAPPGKTPREVSDITPRVAPPPPPPGEVLFRDSDFAVLRDAYTGSVAVASRTEVTNTPPLTLV